MIFKKYKYSILSFLYLTISAYLIRASIDDNILYNILFAILNGIIIQSIIKLFSCFKKVIIIPFIIILSLMITIDITHYLCFSSILSIGAIASMFETNSSESFDAIKMLYPTAIPCFILTLLIIGLSTFELQKKSRNYLIPLLAIGGSFLFICSLLYIMSEGGRSRMLKDFQTSPTLALQLHLGYRIPLVINQDMAIIAYLREMYEFRSEIKTNKELPKGINLQPNPTNKLPRTIIVLLGESSLQSHYSLYGYDLPTTPFLDSLKESHKLYYYNAISPAPITREALTLSLTFASPLNKTAFFENKNIVSLAQDAGYKTYWISNQDKVGMYDSYVGLIASHASHSEFHNFQKDDLELIDIVNYLCNPKEQQIFFIHLKGSHLAYEDKLDSIDIKNLSIPMERESFANYDRTIHHTDRVLKKLYETIFKQDTINSKLLFYYSDHGEIINRGHGFRNHNIDQFQIPFLSISEQLNYETDAIIKKYMNDGKLNTSSFIYILAENLGYRIQDSVVNKALKEAQYYLDVDGQHYPISNITDKVN